MNKLKVKCTLTLIITLLLCITAAPSAIAAISGEITINETGIDIQYQKGLLKPKEINLTVGGSPYDLIHIGPFVVLQISVDNIQTDRKIATLHFNLQSIFLTNPIQGTIPLPFGIYGIDLDRGGFSFQTPKGSAIEASVLLTRRLTRYYVNIDLGETFTDRWEGSANPPLNRKIHIDIPNDNPTLSIDLRLLYYNLRTTVVFIDSITGTNVPPLPSYIKNIPIPLPNGAYQIWGTPE